MSYTVTLRIPDCCDPGDWQHAEPTPINAVEDFIVQATGQPDLWTYHVLNDDTGECFHVDMAAGPSVAPIEGGN